MGVANSIEYGNVISELVVMDASRRGLGMKPSQEVPCLPSACVILWVLYWPQQLLVLWSHIPHIAIMIKHQHIGNI